jgi:ribosomal protein S18 acetylase RimI-like enzyme
MFYNFLSRVPSLNRIFIMSVLNQPPLVSASEPAIAYEIKIAKASDIPQLVEVLMNSFYPPQRLSRWVAPLMRLGLYEDLKIRLTSQTKRYFCWVAMPMDAANPEVLGTVELSLRQCQPWRPFCRRRAYIANLAVNPTSRRQGIAKKLLEQCETVALQWGYSTLYLHVAIDNPAAICLYQQLGYRFAQLRLKPGWLSWLPQKRYLLVKYLKCA